MRYFLGPAQDTRYQPLSDIFILASLSYLARSDLVDCDDYSSRETHEEMVITVLLVVPDLHTFIRKLLLTSTEPMLNYYRTKSERESGCTGYELMFDQIFTKLLEHREGLDTGDGRSKDHGMANMQIPVVTQRAELNKTEMFHRGLRGLQGATIDVYSKLLYSVPDVSFSKTAEGYVPPSMSSIGVTDRFRIGDCSTFIESIDELYKSIRKLFQRWTSVPDIVDGIDAPDAKISCLFPPSILGSSSGNFVLSAKDEEIPKDTKTASKELRIEFHRFYVTKMEQLLTTEYILTNRHISPYASLISFLNDVGGDRYFFDE
ncbi:hypothetical protein PTTW11_07244 [Pyrenophora teres f. teres]|uniref:Uncharacterized protein n=1 Tax=Pyrenophora teres f. teres TaxID=97479 RepID=A0A6S6W503_9PLEO|nr:hypothetical protein PTTW11_07244 [Pyrenophora teres f. teres]